MELVCNRFTSVGTRTNDMLPFLFVSSIIKFRVLAMV